MQDSRFPTLAATILIGLTLSACAPYRPASGKAAMCNQLNSQMVFGSNTSDTRRAGIQDAESQLVARTYDKDQCR